MTQPTLGIFGFGYTAQYLVQHLENRYRILATTRQPFAHPEVTLLEFTSANVRYIYETADFILHSIPPDVAAEDILQKHLLSARAKWFGYLSATSVYGDHQGAWVTEQTVPQPVTPQGKRRLESENIWKNQEKPWHIFRLSGIYGPNRNSLIRIYQGQDFTITAPQVFSRIHVTDIARALEASMQKPTPGEIYNLSDNEPATRADVDNYAAHLLNRSLQQQTLTEAPLSPTARAFYQSSKRVSSKKIQHALQLAWHYPTYRLGLKALLSTMTS